MSLLLPKPAAAAEDIIIREWQTQWVEASAPAADTPPADGQWQTVTAQSFDTRLPDNTTGIWVRTTLPPSPQLQLPALMVERLYGQNVSVYLNNSLIYDSTRSYRFDLNKLFVPLESLEELAMLHIRITGLGDRAGLLSDIRVGDFAGLGIDFVRNEIPDILLSSGLMLLGLVMLPCVGFLNPKLRGPWLSLAVIWLGTGLLILTYSPITYVFYHAHGDLLLIFFNLCLLVLVPSFLYFVDKMLDQRVRLLTNVRCFQTFYSAACIILFAVNACTSDNLFGLFQLFSVQLFGLLIAGEFLLVIILSFRHAASGNKNALILSFGITIFTLAVLLDLFCYYLTSYQHVLWLWKPGIIGMLFSLVLILARSIAADHAMLVAYSKELEEYNVRLQRTEKLKIISDLAASVAHEVRNPLQVTRGFLQLLSEKSRPNDNYYEMAINELDRASSIITDFLTFAKPEMDQFNPLDVTDELDKIHAIMSPHASLNGVVLRIEAHEPLRIMGNSSKFKQAIMNFIKNSIEAIEHDGEIVLRAFRREGRAIIIIRDNGEGMNKEEIAKLGAPYYSTKTKGTGLGLMVTFRIIEAMNGTISFDSEKGKGTEVTLRFPIAE